MSVLLALLMMGITDAEFSPELEGSIQGVVVDGTRDNQPLEGVEVVLRAGTGGELIPVAETKTDRYGKFLFSQVPLDPTLEYMPGANREGVHYPGQRVRIDTSNPIANVRVATFDAVAEPCPLVATQHDIDVVVEQRALKVTERLSIANPTRTTYVGQSPMVNGPPVTMRLSIPQNFDRVTFEKEFYGRRFWIIEHQPMTDIPWLPGKYELTFSYHIPLSDSAGQFRRLLDMPTSKVRVSLRGADARRVSCNLPRSSESEDKSEFVSADEELPQAYAIVLQLESLPFPWMRYARWGSLVGLVALASATVVILRWRRRFSQPRQKVQRKPLPKRRRAA